MDAGFIEIRGARTHNLRGFDLTLPRGQLIAIAGVSGSGKSSLAFDTLFAEGQRRYLESVAPFARRILDQLERPDVDDIAGLPPTLSIAQSAGLAHSNPRSTVATLTEIHDFLRLLYARTGDVFCYQCGAPVGAQSLEQMLDATLGLPEGTRFYILAPLVRGHKGLHKEAFQLIRREGFLRARVDGAIVPVDPLPALDPQRPHDVEMVVDRQILRTGLRPRLAESFATALKHGDGTLLVATEAGGHWHDQVYSNRYACLHCHINYRELEPRTFSFNSPFGACPACKGLGRQCARAPDLPEEGQTAAALPGKRGQSRREAAEETAGFDFEAPLCPECHGARLGPVGRSVSVGGLRLHELTAQTIAAASDVLAQLRFPAAQASIAAPLIRAVATRLEFLRRVGVGYIALDRPVETLSGGEARRIRLASCAGAGLNGVCYVLDEPTAGLHARDTNRLLDLLEELRDRDNTVIVVEHDEAVLRRAQFLVDLGPGAGTHGGAIVNQGPFPAFLQGPGLTADYLRGIRTVAGVAAAGPTTPAAATSPSSSTLTIRGATYHNLKDVTVTVPLDKLVCVTGVSGSGKTTLVMDVLVPAMRSQLRRTEPPANGRCSLEGAEVISRLVAVEQAPLGRSPRAIPATAVGIFDAIRHVFAQTRDAKVRGYTASRFSYNSKAGQCPHCHGLGAEQVELALLPEARVPCPVCRGTRYNRATLAVEYRGHSIAGVLALPVDAAAVFFENHPKIAPVLAILREVGLGYLTLDQPTQTLSGGEAQRLKLAAELAVRSEGKTLFVLDEPTSGLHFEDVAHLLWPLRRLVERGDSVVVIEHQLDLVRAADWIIDLGPEGGNAGGQLVAAGLPATIAACPASITGAVLRQA